MATNPNLRNWTERNQGSMPQSDPMSKKKSQDMDISRGKEGDDTSGDVVGQPGASGNSGNGTARGVGSIGGTGSLSEDQPKA